MAVGCGAQCAKILLIVFNIVFWLSGAALLGLGIWMFIDKDISNYIKVFSAFDQGGAFIRYAAIVFICVGCFVLLVGFLGCCGAIKESRCMLGMYIALLVIVMAAEIAAAVIVLVFKDEYMFFLVIVMAAEIVAAVFVLLFRNKYIACLVIIMAAEIAGAVLALVFRNKILNDMENEMKTLITKHYGKKGDDTSEAFTEGMDYIHEELKCCGVAGKGDFATTPASCCKGVVTGTACPNDAYYESGCSAEIKKFVEDNSTILMIVGFCVAGIEIFGFIFAVCLCRNVGEED